MIQFFEDRGVKIAVTSDGKLNLKGLSKIDSDTRQEVLTFARQNKKQILSKLQTPPPNLSKIHPGQRSEYTRLWFQGHKLADFIDGNTASYEDRIAKLPELTRLSDRMQAIESLLLDKGSVKKGHVNNWDSMIRCPVGTLDARTTPAPVPLGDDPGTCPACGQSRWWRLDKPNSKWICGRCHPPARAGCIHSPQK